MPESLILTDPARTLGRPTIAGTRVTVAAILDKLAAGQTPAQILEAYPELPPQAIPAALKFAAELLHHQSVPLDVLGPQPMQLNEQPALAVRAFVPGAEQVNLLREGDNLPAMLVPAAPAEPTLPPMDQPVDASELTSFASLLFAAPPPPTAPGAMTQVHTDGVFEIILPGQTQLFPYQLQVRMPTGETYIVEDPYRFSPTLTESQLRAAVTEARMYDLFGAHVFEHEGLHGVRFVVWAPHAERVSVVGEFNAWDGRRHPMRPVGETGVWELFLPNLGEGTVYNYEIKSRYGWMPMRKADPFAFAAELRPKFGSIVWDTQHYTWHDEAWLEQRATAQGLGTPISIYEVHLGSWRRGPDTGQGQRWLTYRELAEQLLPYVKRLGFTHIELMPVAEHPFDGSWGYQIINYFAPTSRFGTPDDFRYFVDSAHQLGLGIIMDWVPAHYPKDAHGLAFFDGAPLYEHTDRRKHHHPDWNTLIFNFEQPEVCAFLLANARFWLEQYHIDGLRVDAVSSMLYLDYSRKAGEWLPNPMGGRENLDAVAFLQQFNRLIHSHFPDVITFAEESSTWSMVSGRTREGGLGFDFKWNMGWMHDTLEYMQTDPLFRGGRQNALTFALTYAFSENFMLPLSHDEVVHGKRSLLNKMPGDPRLKFANLRALYAYMYAHPGKKLLFMGGELGQWQEWNHDLQLEWHLLGVEANRQLHQFVRDLNHLYRSRPALHAADYGWEGFQWIDCSDTKNSVLSFIRRGADGAQMVVVVNFTPMLHKAYRIGLPLAGTYREVLNSDAVEYGGGGAGNAEGVAAEPLPWQNQPYSAALTLPPLGVVFLEVEGKVADK